MKSLQQLLEEKQTLEDDLVRIKLELQTRTRTKSEQVSIPETSETTPSTFSSPSLSKSGYLSKWQDRQIGWGGTKWDLRFVRLERGKLSYFLHHHDLSPRYILTLKNCAVRDDGAKPNAKFKGKLHGDHDHDHESDHEYDDADLRTPGAFHHVFSVYQRPKEGTSGRGTTAEHDQEDHIVPLLRFSTENYAEKVQWMDMLTASCFYCDSKEFEEDERRRQEMHMEERDDATISSMPMPRSRGSGLLPVLYFAPPAPKIKRQPSHMKLNKDKNSAKSNSKHTSGYPPSKPMHRSSEPSYLSDEAPMQNYRGLLNLGLIILVFSNFRVSSRVEGRKKKAIQ